MRNKSGTILLVLGAVLIMSALSLLLWNRKEDQMAGSQAGEVLEQLRDHVSAATLPSVPEIPPETAPLQTRPSELETIVIDGYE